MRFLTRLPCGFIVIRGSMTFVHILVDLVRKPFTFLVDGCFCLSVLQPLFFIIAYPVSDELSELYMNFCPNKILGNYRVPSKIQRVPA